MPGVYKSDGAEQTMRVAETFAHTLKGGELLLLLGDMGAGKTTFCRGLAAGLGTRDVVQSPTFAIANYYRGTPPLAHFDAWRINSADDLETAGFYDYLDQGAVVAVEWAENILHHIDPPYYTITIKQLNTEKREITIDYRTDAVRR